MSEIYLFKSPIKIEETESGYDIGEVDSYFLHTRVERKSHDLAKKIQEKINEEEGLNLAEYLDEHLKEIVTRITVKVEDLAALTEVESVRPLTEEEMEDLKDDITGQFSDGWGEGFEQHEIDTYEDSFDIASEEDDEDDGSSTETVYSTVDVYASFWNADSFELQLLDGNVPSKFSKAQKPSVKLVGEDGNIFSIMGRVTRVLKQEGLIEQAEELKEKVHNSKSYDQALQIIMDYVEVY